jgi:hypothetical protein
MSEINATQSARPTQAIELPEVADLDHLPDGEYTTEFTGKAKLSNETELPGPIARPPQMAKIEASRGGFLADLTIIEVILSHRAYFFAAVRDCEELWVKIRAMVVSCFVFFGLYGAVMGAAQSPLQAMSAAIKLPILFVITLFICAPSLYFLSKFFSSTQRLSQYIALILSAMTIMAILLLSFAPVTFFFLITGSSYPFFKLLNVFFFAVAGLLSVAFFRHSSVATRDPHNMAGIGARRLIFFVWVILYAFVGTQMAWTLSPFMGDPTQHFMMFTQGGNFYNDVAQSLRKLLGQ